MYISFMSLSGPMMVGATWPELTDAVGAFCMVSYSFLNRLAVASTDFGSITFLFCVLAVGLDSPVLTSFLANLTAVVPVVEQGRDQSRSVAANAGKIENSRS